MPSPKAPRILAIDDDNSIRQSICHFLEDYDYEVITAANGREGLELFEKRRPDLILLDLGMSETNGLEVLKRIKKANPEQPVIVASETGIIQDVIKALHLGAWDYLVKPIEDMAVLRYAIERALERLRLIRENLIYQQGLEKVVYHRTAELEKANQELRQSNLRLRRIVETTKQISTGTDVDQFGRQLLEEFGRHMVATGGSLYITQTRGLRLIHALDPGHAPDFIPFPLQKDAIFQRILTDGQPILVENIKGKTDFSSSGWGHYKDGSLLAFPLLDENGKIIALISLHSKNPPPFIEQDKEMGSILASISCETLKAARAMEVLRESEEKFRSYIDNAPDAIFIVDQKGNYLEVNQAATRMTGYTTDELLSMNLLDLVPSESRRKASNYFDQVIKIGKATTDIPFAQKDGGSGNWSITAVKLSQNRFLQFAKDTTDERQLELQLRQAHKMESIGTLAGGIAHDFNNILSSILGYTELTLATLPEDDSQIRQFIAAVLRAGERARELVSQILTFSRQGEQIYAPIEIHLVVKEALQLLRSSLPSTIEIRQKIAVTGRVIADPTQIHQVIMNLCTNAYHAMEESGGILSVELSYEEIDLMGLIRLPDLTPGTYLKLSVSDTGKGMGPAIIERIFDPYFTTKKKGKGTGLGLSVVHGIVKSHQGTITAESSPGKGSVFNVYLPATRAHEEVKPTPTALLPMGDERILLVDDEKEIVEIEQQMLQHLGYQVITRESSLEALETFRTSPDDFDVVVTDLTMPSMTGERLTRELIRLRPDIPVILCTGFSEMIDEEKAASLGIKKFLFKPVSMADFAMAVREVLEKR
jgi:PAS domain S-box-containing protein